MDAVTLAKALYQYKDFVWLDSARGGDFSIIAWEATQKLVFRAGEEPQRFLDFLRQAGGDLSAPRTSPFYFTSGWIGFMHYEAALLSSLLPPALQALLRQGMENNKVVAAFSYYSSLIWIDAHTGKTFFVSTAIDAETIWQALLSRLAAHKEPTHHRQTTVTTLAEHISRSHYDKIIAKIRADIAAGRYYQINFSQEFSAPFAGDVLALYLALRQESPAAMMAFMRADEEVFLSASPECFFKIKAGGVATFPIKGTLGTHKTHSAAEEELQKATLLADPKEAAELLMITDLLRNDLGRVCQTGTVRVTGFPILETHTHYHHLRAEISGVLHSGTTLDEVFCALFPGGSITGAPKIEAMRAIQEYEARSRGIYTGSIGMIGGHGFVEFSIVIRTVIAKDQQLRFATGGGIVYDSEAGREYEECLVKGAAIRAALRALL